MIEVGREGHATAEDIFGREINVDGLCAACRLGVVAFDAAYESLIVLYRYVGIEVEVVADALLRSFHLEHGVEVDDLVAGAEGQAFGRCFDDLSGRGVESEGAFVAVFGREFYVVLHRGVEADERREAFVDGYRRDIVGRRRYRSACQGVEREPEVLAVGGDPVEIG